MAPVERFTDEILRSSVVDTAEAAAFCRFSVAHWRRLYRRGIVPAPVRLSTRKYGWRIGDLVDWIEARRTQNELHSG